MRFRDLLLAFRNKPPEELLIASDTVLFNSFKTDSDRPMHEKDSSVISNKIVPTAVRYI